MMTHYDVNSWKHFGVNAVLSLVLGLFGLGIGLGASVTKEWCDKIYAGHWCWADFGFDVLGMVTGSGLHVLIMWLILK